MTTEGMTEKFLSADANANCWFALAQHYERDGWLKEADCCLNKAVRCDSRARFWCAELCRAQGLLKQKGGAALNNPVVRLDFRDASKEQPEGGFFVIARRPNGSTFPAWFSDCGSGAGVWRPCDDQENDVSLHITHWAPFPVIAEVKL